MLGSRILRCGRGIALAVVLVALWGCGGTAASPEASPAPTEAATPAPTTAPTPAPTEAPTEPPSASAPNAEGVLCAADREICELAAGTYRTNAFKPAFSLTVDDGWKNVRDFPDGGGVAIDTGGVYWASGISSGIANGAEVTFESTVDGFADHLRSIDGLKVAEGPTGTVGGDTATVLDVTSGASEHLTIFFLADDAYFLSPGQKARFFLLDRDGTLVIVVEEATSEAEFDAVLERTQPVIDSITWE